MPTQTLPPDTAEQLTAMQLPTTKAFADLKQAVEHEQQALQEMRNRIDARLGELATYAESLPSLNGSATTPVETISLEDQEPGATETPAAAQTAAEPETAPEVEMSVGDMAEHVLSDAGRAIGTEEIARRIEEQFSAQVDKRGLAGALNGGVRSGRFGKTPTGRYKLNEPALA